MDFLKYDITNLAYAARTKGRVAMIGVGSGRDMLSAYIFGARDMTGVEVNPIFIDLLTDPGSYEAISALQTCLVSVSSWMKAEVGLRGLRRNSISSR